MEKKESKIFVVEDETIARLMRVMLGDTPGKEWVDDNGVKKYGFCRSKNITTVYVQALNIKKEFNL